MIPKPNFKLAACASAGALTLLLNLPAFGEATVPGTEAATPAAEEGTAPSPWAAGNAGDSMETPALLGPPQPQHWMSYGEMQDMMRAQGVDLPPMPSPSDEILPPPVPPFMGGANPDEQKRLFDIFETMTPEQQEACFAVARWQSPSQMPPQMPIRMPMPPGYRYQHGAPFTQQGASFPPAYRQPPGQSFPAAMPPRQ